MLQNIRDKTSGWIATAILGTIIIVFGLSFGIQDFLSTNVKTDVAGIEGEGGFLGFNKEHEQITQAEFRARFDQVRQQKIQQEGEAFDPLKFESAESKREILETLIDEKLIEFASQQKKMLVTDAMLLDAQKKMPEFHNQQGVFDPMIYKSFLASRGLSEKQVDQMIRENMQRQMVPVGITASGMASDQELKAFLKLSQQTRDLRYVVLPPSKTPAVLPSDAEITEWYKKNLSSRYRSQEQVSIEYVEVDGNGLPVSATVDDAALKSLYQKNINAYRTAEQKMASHIFFALAKDASAAKANEVLAKANDIAKQARASTANFASLAKQYSEDAGSKEEGGDLGVVEKDVFDPAFEQAFNKLQLGQVSEPVRAADGYHVILYRENIPGEVRPFEQVRAELETTYFERERERLLNSLVDKLLDGVLADPTKLAASAKALNLQSQKTGLFTRGQGEGVAALEPIRSAAFSEALKTNREVSDPIELEANKIVVFRVVEHKPAGDTPLAQIRSAVIADLQADRLEKSNKQRAEALAARGNQGTSLDAIAKELASPVSQWPKMPRNPPVPQLADVAKAAFAMPVPSVKKQIGIAKLPGGGYSLIEISAVNEGDISSLDAEALKNLRKNFASMRGKMEADAYVKALRKQYKVEVIESNL
jgi:peptidyl-prolyl cis-trans isomerase D